MRIEAIYDKVNTYFIIKGHECLMVDPGTNEEAIKEFINKNNLKVVGTILTHGHFDHMMCCNSFDSPIYIHQEDKSALYDPKINYSYMVGSEFILDSSIEVYEIDEHTTSIKGFDLRIIPIKGHSPGSICIYIEELKRIMVGDILAVRQYSNPNRIFGGEALYIKTMNERLFTLPEDTVLLNGHGEDVVLGNELREPFYSKQS